MSTERFQPIGEMARWRILVDRFAAVDRGTTVTYGEMAEVLDLDPVKDRKAISAAVRAAPVGSTCACNLVAASPSSSDASAQPVNARRCRWANTSSRAHAA